jgi:hypothetical protein
MKPEYLGFPLYFGFSFVMPASTSLLENTVLDGILENSKNAYWTVFLTAHQMLFGLFYEPRVGLAQAILERDLGRPTQPTQPRDI